MQSRDVQFYNLPGGMCMNSSSPVLAKIPEDPKDSVILAKPYLASTSLSQPPALLLRAELAKVTDSLEVTPKNILLPRAVAEFDETAALAGSFPWCTKNAQAFLTSWHGTVAGTGASRRPSPLLPLVGSRWTPGNRLRRLAAATGPGTGQIMPPTRCPLSSTLL